MLDKGITMAQEFQKSDLDIARCIISSNTFNITEVNEVKTINSFYFVPEHYQEVEELIKSGDIHAIELLPLNKNDTFQYYYVMTFVDQKMKPYVVTVYDSNELWQDPQVIEVFPI